MSACLFARHLVQFFRTEDDLEIHCFIILIQMGSLKQTDSKQTRELQTELVKVSHCLLYIMQKSYGKFYPEDQTLDKFPSQKFHEKPPSEIIMQFHDDARFKAWNPLPQMSSL